LCERFFYNICLIFLISKVKDDVDFLPLRIDINTEWTIMNANCWLEVISAGAKKGFESIKDIIGTPKAREKIQKNKLGDITLVIDKKAEKAILEEIQLIPENIRIISEEQGEFSVEDGIPEDQIHDYIIIDPVDGSHNASFGFPMSCISIAHATGPKLNDIDCGVILNIYNEDIYTAIKGQGALKNGESIHVNTRENLPKCLFGMNFSVNESLFEYTQRYAEFFDKCKPMRIRSIGTDAFALTLFAEGKLDLFMNLQNKTRTLDIAAAAIILKEAGGILIDPYGEELNPPLALMTRISFVGISPTLKKQFDPLIPILSSCFKNQPIIN
jgi:myo-inositol-1(or 4)-monophosphatase